MQNSIIKKNFEENAFGDKEIILFINIHSRIQINLHSILNPDYCVRERERDPPQVDLLITVLRDWDEITN